MRVGSPGWGRRVRLPALLRLVPVLAALGLLTTSCDWVQWRFDNAHTGYNANETAVNPSNASHLVLRWKAKTAGWVATSAAVVYGSAFEASTDGTFYAYDTSGRGACFDNTPRNCAPEWVVHTGGPIYSSPTVADGVVYVGSSDGYLYAFPAVPNPATCTGGPPVECPASWRVQTGGPVLSSPVVDGSTVYVGSDDGKLWAVNTAGAVEWTAATGGPVRSSPALSGGTVYVGSDDGKLYAFDAGGCAGPAPPITCTPLWTAATGGPVRSSPSVADGKVYVGSDDAKLYAFDAAGTTGCTGPVPATCTPLWSFTTGGPVSSSPAVAGNTVLVGSADGLLRALSTTGQLQWQAVTSQAIVASPAIGGALVYISSADGHVRAYDLAGSLSCTGTPKVCTALWDADTGSGISASPTIAGGAVTVGTTDGQVLSWQLPIVPVAPAAPTAALTNVLGHVTIAWAAPEDDGGSPVTGYLVEGSTDDGTHWSTVASVPASPTSTDYFCGTSGTTCEFRVTASNAVGPSPASAVSEAVTIPTPNSPPVFTLGASPTVNADVGPQTISPFASITSPGPLPGETVTFTVTNDDHGLFSTQPAIDSSGTLTFTPKLLAVTGTATVSVTAQNNGGTAYGGTDTSSTQTFSISVNSVNQPPTVGTPSTATRGNTHIAGSAPGVLAGSADPEGGAVHVCSAGTVVTAKGGSISLLADGSYTYGPKAGFIGTDTASFSVCDSTDASTPATLTISVDGPEIWYVDGAAGVNGTGTDQSPFNTLASASSASATGDVIYLEDSGTVGANAGINLKAHVQLIGAGVALVRSPDNADIPAGTAPVITRAGSVSPVVTLADGNTVSGVTISGAASASGAPGLSGNAVADATLDHLQVSSPAGPGISLTNASGTVALSDVTVSGASDDAIAIHNTTTNSLAVTIDQSSISGTSQAGNGLLVRTNSPGGHPDVSVAVTHTAFTAIDDGADAINIATANSGSSTLGLTVTDSTFDNVASGHPQGDNAIRATNDGGAATMRLDIESNTFRNWVGDVISVRARGNGGQVIGPNGGAATAQIVNNTIGDTTDTSVVGSSGGHGISVLVDPHIGAPSTSADVTISGNHVGGTALEGITVGGVRGLPPLSQNVLHATITNNVIRLATNPILGALSIHTADESLVCAAETGNDVGVGGGGSTTTGLSQGGPSELAIVGTADFPGQSPAAYVNSHNAGANTIVSGSPILVAANTSGCGNP